jgi:hypothetical protein
MADIEKEIKKEEKKLGKFFKKKENIWMSVSILLAVVVIIMFIVSLTSGISKASAGSKMISYLTTLIPAGDVVTLKNVTSLGNVYEITVDYKGQSIPVYMTRDGKYMINGLQEINPSPSVNTNTNTQTPAEVPKSDKPVVQLYVMSHCPYGVEAQKIFMPMITFFGNKADVKMHFVSYAMHGKQELDDNNIEYCLQKEQPSAFISFMNCFVASEDSAACLSSTSGIDKTKLNSCISSTDAKFKITSLYNNQSTWLSGRYPQYPVEASLNKEFGVQGSETFIVNGVHISPSEYRWDVNKMKDIICNAFTTKPAECSQAIASSGTSAGPSAGSCS